MDSMSHIHHKNQMVYADTLHQHALNYTWFKAWDNKETVSSTGLVSCLSVVDIKQRMLVLLMILDMSKVSLRHFDTLKLRLPFAPPCSNFYEFNGVQRNGIE